MRKLQAGIFSTLSMALTLTGCQPFESGSEIDEAALRRHVRQLADDTFEGRNGGYEGERRAAQYIADHLQRLELEPAGDAGTFLQAFEFQPRLPERPGQRLTSQNVVAILKGRRLTGSVEAIVVGEHYDGQGRTGQADPGREANDLALPDDEIWNAANDNAASVAIILEVARLFRTGRFVNERDLIFCLFGAEEHGIVGAFAYVNAPAVPLVETAAMLNLEQLGGLPGEDLMTAGFATSSAWPDVLARADARTGRSTLLALDLPAADTDHYPFFVLGVPAMTLGHPDGPRTHTPADDPESLSYPDLVWRTELVATVVEELASLESRPGFALDVTRELAFTAVVTSPAEVLAAGLRQDVLALKVAAVLRRSTAFGQLEVGDLITVVEGQRLSEGMEYEIYRLGREKRESDCLSLSVVTGGRQRGICL